MRIKSVLAALGIGLAMVLSLDYVSFAATGHSLILGHGNTASYRTSLTRTTPGTTLQLNSKPGWPSLAVNQTAKVARLNADRVDDYEGSQMLNRTVVYERSLNLTAVPGFSLTLANVPAGSYLTTVDGWVYGPANSSHECFLRAPSTGRTLESWDNGNPSGYLAPNIVGAIDVPSTQNLTFQCTGTTGNYTSYSGAPMQITLSPIGQKDGAGFARHMVARSSARAATR